MDGKRFDEMARQLWHGGSRRSLLLRLGAVPVLGGLAGFLAVDADEDAEAKKNKNKNNNRQKNKGKKHKRRCQQSKAQACDGQCGTVTLKCKKAHKKPGKKRKSKKHTIDCGSCACQPACDACFTCDSATTTCVLDPEQTGDACGFGGVCQANGACACDATSCPANATCTDGACVCDGGLEACGAACVDTQTDAENCGACGNACPATAVCDAGTCACPEGQKNCNGQCIAQDACCGVCAQLTWATPDADLDTHVWAPDGTEIWYQNLGSVSESPFIALDFDDTEPPGLEQVSIAQLLPGTTSYAVVNWNTCNLAGTDFGTGDATVSVTRDGAPLGTFTLTTATGTGVWWNVFTINDAGAVTPINQLSNTPLQPSEQLCNAFRDARSGSASKKTLK